MRVTLKADADLTAHIFPGEECVVEGAVRTCEPCGNGISKPTLGLCECSDGGAEGVDFSPGCRWPRGQPAVRAGTGADDSSGAGVREFRGGGAWFTLGMLQGYWQCPLDEASQELFTFVNRKRLFHSHAGAPGSAEHHFVLAGDDAHDCKCAGREYLRYARR